MNRDMGATAAFLLALCCFTTSLTEGQECNKPLGMQDGTISNGQISASSERRKDFRPANARLNFSGTGVRVGAWVAGETNSNQWLQVDFGNVTIVTGIGTQGRTWDLCDGCENWVKKYKVSYSLDNATFPQYKENGSKVKEFRANSDRDSIVRHVLSPPVVARYIRINPTNWSRYIAMRVEFWGCRAGSVGQPYLTLGCFRDNGSAIDIQSMEGQDPFLNDSYHSRENPIHKCYLAALKRGYQVFAVQHGGQCFSGPAAHQTYNRYGSSDACEADGAEGPGTNQVYNITALNCSQPLGMEDGTILDRQISASSERRVDFGPANARLNFSGPGVRAGAWLAGTQDDNQWLQVDFGNETRVTGIDTQGRRCGKCHQWVKEYTVSYSKDNVTFHKYKQDGKCQVKVFKANSDRDSIVHIVLSPPVVARYIRVNPTKWNRSIAMRVEFRGCRAVNSSESEPYSASLPSKSSSSAPLCSGAPSSSNLSTNATLPPRMTSSPAAVTATSSGRNPAAPTANTESLSQQQTKTSFIDITSSDVKMQSTESSSLDGESSEAPASKTTSIYSSPGPRSIVVTKLSSLTPTATSPAASPLRDYQQGLASFSATPAAASSIKQAKSSQGISASSPAAVAATSSGRNPAAPTTNTVTSSQQRRSVSLIDTAASGVKMQSTEGSHLNRKSFGTLAAKATNYQQVLTSFAATSPVASSTNQVKSSYLNSALSAVRTESLGPAATPSGPPATTRLLPSATPSQANAPRDVVPTSSVVEGKAQDSPLAKFKLVLTSANPETKSSLPMVLDATTKVFTSAASIQGPSLLSVAREFEEFSLKYAEIHLKDTKKTLTFETNALVLHIRKLSPDQQENVTFPEPDASGTDSEAFVKLPPGTFGNESVVLVGVVYKNLQSEFNEDAMPKRSRKHRINSDILAVSAKSKEGLKKDVTVVFKNRKTLKKDVKSSEVHCVYWRFHLVGDGGKWSRTGCDVSRSTATHTECTCDHMTHYAVLMPSQREIPKGDQDALTVITYTGLSLSIATEILTIVAFVLYTEISEPRSQVRINFTSAMLAVQVIFLAGIGATQNHVACIAVALFLQYFLLAQFCWSFIEAVVLYRYAVRVFNVEIKPAYLYAFAWGFPGLVVLPSLVFALTQDSSVPFVQEEYCWLHYNNGLLWSFSAIAFALISINIIILGCVVKVVSYSPEPATTTKVFSARKGAKAAALLCPLLGVTWVVAFLNFSGTLLITEYLFAILNSMQGCLIFFLHTLRNSEIREKIGREVQNWLQQQSWYQGASTSRRGNQIDVDEPGEGQPAPKTRHQAWSPHTVSSPNVSFVHSGSN